jgi:hypothetical protein
MQVSAFVLMLFVNISFEHGVNDTGYDITYDFIFVYVVLTAQSNYFVERIFFFKKQS